MIRVEFYSNRSLAIFGACGIVENAIYYILFVNDLFWVYIVNFSLVAVISLLLFYTHSFAGGDCKLVIVMAMLYPSRLYLEYGRFNISLFIAVGLAIFFGYIYLVITSFIAVIDGKNKVTKGYFISSIIGFVKNFAVATTYIVFIGMLSSIFNTHSLIQEWIVRIMCIAVAWYSSRLKLFKKWYVLGPVLVVDILMCFYFRVFPLGKSMDTYLMIIILLVCQITVRTNFYDEISLEKLKKGMILSMGCSVLMQNSRVRGLPGISTEDLKSRLTQEQVESIKRWAEGKKINELTIVKKIPFAVFILLGFSFYLMMWGFANYAI